MSERPVYDLVYRWRKYNPALYGRRCRLLKRGTMNSALVEWEGGGLCVVSLNALRRLTPAAATRG